MNARWAFAIFLFGSASIAVATDPPASTRAAVACLEDAACPAAKAKALYDAAVDAGAKGVDCTWIYYGILVDRDLDKAFRCFDRALQEEGGCNGGSPSMERLYYASMLLSGQGTKADPARASKVFDGCFVDASVPPVLDAATEHQNDPSAPPFDACKDNDGTTFSMSQCHAILGKRDEVKGLLRGKDAFEHLEPDVRSKWTAAQAAWTTFAEKSATFYAGTEGTIVTIRYPLYLAGAQKERSAAIAKFPAYAPAKNVEAKDLAAEERTLAERYEKAVENAGGEADQQNLRDAESAWTAFRDAETALYRTAYGKKFGDAVVDLDMRLRLTKRRNRDLRPLHSKS